MTNDEQRHQQPAGGGLWGHLAWHLLTIHYLIASIDNVAYHNINLLYHTVYKKFLE